MPRKRKPRLKHQGIDFVIGGLRKIVRDSKSSVAQRMKALDRLAVIDGILDIELAEPNDITRQSEPNPETDAEKRIQRAIAEIMKSTKPKSEEKDGIPNGSESTDSGVRESVG